MREYQERRYFKRLLHSRYMLAVLGIILVLCVRGVWGAYIKYEKSKDMAGRMKADLTALNEREISLNQSIDALRTDEGKEREARDRFGVVKEGEKMIVLVDNAPKSEFVATSSREGFWDRFLGFFGL